MINNYINTLLVKFSNEISFKEIALFRGAVLNLIGDGVELLFHNHVGDGFRYSYPLIQYKRIHKKASLLCVGDGVEVISQFFEKHTVPVTLGNRQIHLEIDSVVPQRTLIQIWDTTFNYHLRNWIPLNSTNYEKYKRLEGISEKVEFLEKILIGNILSFAKGLNIDIKDRIVCRLLSINEPHLTTVKGVKMNIMDVKFKTNLSLPDYMGIGKHASIGYGTIVRVYNSGE